MWGGWRWQLAQNAEKIWWRFYLRKRPVQPYLAWKKNYWNQLLLPWKEFLAVKEGTTVLDAGCGPAGVFMVLDTCQVDALDPLLSSYQQLDHFNSSWYPWVHFIPLEMEELAEDKKYACIFCMNVINHVRDIEKAVTALVSYLEDGGRLVLTVDAHQHAWLKPLFRLLPGDVLHPQQFGLDEYKKMFLSSGLHLHTAKKIKRDFLFDHYLLLFEKKLNG